VVDFAGCAADEVKNMDLSSTSVQIVEMGKAFILRPSEVMLKRLPGKTGRGQRCLSETSVRQGLCTYPSDIIRLQKTMSFPTLVR
jgi:hypothetical protein